MRDHTRLRRAGILMLAICYAVIVAGYCGLWFYSAPRTPIIAVELGFENRYVPAENGNWSGVCSRTALCNGPDSRTGDRIVALDGRRIDNPLSLSNFWSRHKPGDTVVLTVDRPGASGPIELTAVFRARSSASSEGNLVENLSNRINDAFPVPFLLVGLPVLFLRLENVNVWLLALMFGGFIAAPNFPNNFASLSPLLRSLAMGYRAIFDSLIGALFYFFFAVFPERSPLDRRVPWLKWAGLGLGIATALPGIGMGDQSAPAVVFRLLGAQGADLFRLTYNYGFIGLGLISLIGNSFGLATPEARRRIRVILWGTLVGVLPIVAQRAAEDFLKLSSPPLLGIGLILLLFLFPLSFAYAVVKHRVLELPVLLRRSARYLLVQRGFTILLAGLSIAATLIFAFFFAGYLGARIHAALPVGIALGSGFGSLLLWTGRKVQRGVGGRIDRAFFRNAYDVRVTLEELAERIRTVTDRKELAELLERHLNEALHPSDFAVYLETGDGRLLAAGGSASSKPATIAPADPLIAELARLGRPRIVAEGGRDLPAAAGLLSSMQPECLVPMLGRDGRVAGFMALGSRLSEEPYSGRICICCRPSRVRRGWRSRAFDWDRR